tara:strand:+ start:154 stop:972 length:819 start_codon:yes stop_codon:yes gene_type:complete
MTKLTFLGTGEAFDPERFNSSYLIEHEGKSLMIDCGADSFKSMMKYAYGKGSSLAEYPDGILLTHDHGDHIAGVPGLLMAMNQEINGKVGSSMIGLGRKIEVMSSNPDLLDLEKYVDRIGFGDWKLFRESGPSTSTRVIEISGDNIYGMGVRAGETVHSVKNYAYRFDLPNGRSIAVSGDGRLTDETRALFRGVDYLIHEGYFVLGDGGKFHGSVESVVDYAIENDIPNVSIVHVDRAERKKFMDIQRMTDRARENGVNLFFPNDNDVIDLS